MLEKFQNKIKQLQGKKENLAKSLYNRESIPFVEIIRVGQEIEFLQTCINAIEDAIHN